MLKDAFSFLMGFCFTLGAIFLVSAMCLTFTLQEGAVVPAFAKHEPKPDPISTPVDTVSCDCKPCRCKNPGDCGADNCNVTLDNQQAERDARVYRGKDGVWYFREDDGKVLKHDGVSWISCGTNGCRRVW